ncbi:M1 family aminopeptidase [Halomonas sp. NO4]|uniref:M1 family metallopeptidase n=1 Tax=Halomonas sp. NO4 TaxID=2484813 RepID=UPI0013D1C222|nr:M1 family aminopeptidase [Halomonas sp. NO4]
MPWLAASLAGLLLALPFPAAAQQVPDSERSVTLRVALDPARQTLEAEMRLQPPPATGAFRLLPGLRVDDVTADGVPLEVTTAAPGEHRVTVPETAEALSLRWRGTLAADDAHLQLSPAGSWLPADTAWYPQFVERADAAPFALALEIQVPEGQRAVGSGSLEGEPRLDAQGYRVRHGHPRARGITVAAGPWRERTHEAEGVRLRTLFPAALDEAFAETYLERAASHLSRFVARLGPYPFESFTVATSPAPVGVAYPGFTLLGERVVPLPFVPETSLAHELMHGWWGVAVPVAPEGGNWSEALTTYLADYHLDERRGEARATRLRWLIDLSALPASKEIALVDFQGGNDPAHRVVGYEQGAMLFHMLRQRIGGAAFDAGLRRLAERHRFEAASWENLAAAFSEASGEALDDVFAAWVARPGRPRLALDGVTYQETAAGWAVEGNLAQSGPGAPWPLQVPLVVETEAGVSRHRVVLESQQAAFTLALEEAPVALAVDPDFDLLRQLEAAPFTLRHLALDPDSRLLALDATAAELGQGIFERSLPRAEGEGSGPRLVVGGTGAVIDWLAAQGIEAPSLARRGRARFWTLPNAALVAASADDRDALARLLRVMRHHQSRSYLVQGPGGETREAGTWPVEEPGLRRDFAP